MGVELEQPDFEFTPPDDRRPRVTPPPPVRLIAVADVELEALAGQQSPLDAFYIDLLGFERAEDDSTLAYQAENFRIRFVLFEKSFQRDDMRSLGIQVRSLAETERKLFDAEIDYTRQKGLIPGQEALLLKDPAGNWVQLVEYRPVG
jgi:hypothetical protein